LQLYIALYAIILLAKSPTPYATTPLSPVPGFVLWTHDGGGMYVMSFKGKKLHLALPQKGFLYDCHYSFHGDRRPVVSVFGLGNVYRGGVL